MDIEVSDLNFSSSGQFEFSSVPSQRGVHLVVSTPRDTLSAVPLVEFSALEAKFISSSPYKWGMPIECMFCFPSEDQMQTVAARVHWSRHVKDSWQVGVFLESCLDPVFGNAMGEDMRSTLRYEVRKPASIKLVGDETEYPVSLLDYSVNGCSLMVNNPQLQLRKREFELFVPNRNVSVAVGRILWQLPMEDDQSMIGARLSGRDLSWFFGIE